jgi:hypothetical protein
LNILSRGPPLDDVFDGGGPLLFFCYVYRFGAIVVSNESIIKLNKYIHFSESFQFLNKNKLKYFGILCFYAFLCFATILLITSSILTPSA